MYFLHSYRYIISRQTHSSCTYFTLLGTSSPAKPTFHVLSSLFYVHHLTTNSLFMYFLHPSRYIISRQTLFSCTFFTLPGTSSRDKHTFHVLSSLFYVHHLTTNSRFMYFLHPSRYIISRQTLFSCTFFTLPGTSSRDKHTFHVLSSLLHLHHSVPIPISMYLRRTKRIPRQLKTKELPKREAAILTKKKSLLTNN